MSPAVSRRPDWAAYLLLMPALALMAFAFIGPMAVFLRFSFFTFTEGKLYEIYTLDAYRQFFGRSFYYDIIGQTLWIGLLTMALTVLVGYPLGYAMWRARAGVRVVLAVLVFLPVTVSAVVRSYGWQTLLADSGPVNWLLIRLGLTGDGVPLVFNTTGVVIAMVHIFLPFAVFPIFTSLAGIDPSVREAAADLGAGWFTALARVTFPLSLPGVVAGAQITLTLTLGAFVTPAMLGGGRVSMLPLTIYNDTAAVNWPIAAVGGLALLVMSLVAVWLFQRVLRARAVGAA